MNHRLTRLLVAVLGLAAIVGCDELPGSTSLTGFTSSGIQSLAGLTPFNSLGSGVLYNGDIPGGTGFLDEEDGIPREVGYCYSMDEEGPFTFIRPSGRCP